MKETLEALVTAIDESMRLLNRDVTSEEVGMASLEACATSTTSPTSDSPRSTRALKGPRLRARDRHAREDDRTQTSRLMRALKHPAPVRMAIYAHPDDADVAAGGPSPSGPRRLRGSPRVVCDGDKGSHVLSADAGAVREVRGAEVEFAADLLGAATVTKLERPDGEVENDVELRAELVGLIRQYRPEVVVGPTRPRRSSPGST